MNLSQLRFASAVATTGSFTAAAAQCCVTQPTLSNGIAQLENELGERLFARTTRKVALSPFGAHLLPYLSEVLRAQVTLEHQARAFLKPDMRLIRIGTSPLIRSDLLSLMIEPFRAQHPGVEVVLREMNMADLYRMLGQGLLDVVIGVSGMSKGPWTTTPLYDEPLLFVPRGAVAPARVGKRPVQLAEIAAETYVMVPDACGLARATRELFRSHRRKLIEYSGEAMSYQVLQEWAALGIGAAILPSSKMSEKQHLAFPITGKSGQRVVIGFEAAWSRERVRAQHLVEFSKHLKTIVPSIVSGLDRERRATAG
jgi:DNA-binding transcriptional LysR family regulator